jgi:hypothetical protein
MRHTAVWAACDGLASRIFHDRLKSEHRSCFHDKFIYDFLHMKMLFFIGFLFAFQVSAAEFLSVQGHLTRDGVLDKVVL